MPETNGTQGTQGATNQGDPGTEQKPQVPASFEDFVKGQPKEVQDLYDAHIKGLKTTVETTRQERDNFSKQLRDAAKKVEKGSELESQLTQLASKLDEANARATFYELAPAMECRNPKAAFAIMTTLGLTTRSGEPDWKSIKEAAPELFGKVIANANVGSGTNDQSSLDPHAQMNDFIRSKGRPR